MASVGTLIASGGGGGATTTITVTATHEANEQIQMFWLTENHDPSFFLSPAFPGSIADSKGGLWATFTGFPARLPELGYTADGNIDGDGKFKIQVASALRTSGFALKIGDTITVTWDVSADPPNESCLIVQGFNGIFPHAVAQTANFGDVEYGNGDSGDTFSLAHTDPNDLSWTNDYGPSDAAIPDENCAFFAAFGSKHGNAFSPHDSPTVVATLQRSALYLAVTFAPLISGAATVEPGGTFSGSTCSVGNYQFVSTHPVVSGGGAAPTTGAHVKGSF